MSRRYGAAELSACDALGSVGDIQHGVKACVLSKDRLPIGSQTTAIAASQENRQKQELSLESGTFTPPLTTLHDNSWRTCGS